MPDVSTWGSRYCTLEAIYFCFCFTQRCMSSMGKNFMHIDTGEAGPIKLTCKLAGASSVQMCVRCTYVHVWKCLCDCERVSVYEDGHFSDAPLAKGHKPLAVLASSGSHMGTWWGPTFNPGGYKCFVGCFSVIANCNKYMYMYIYVSMLVMVYVYAYVCIFIEIPHEESKLI